MAVNWAYSNGIINGIDDNQFAPNDAATRAQVARILMGIANHANSSVPTPTTDNNSLGSISISGGANARPSGSSSSGGGSSKPSGGSSSGGSSSGGSSATLTPTPTVEPTPTPSPTPTPAEDNQMYITVGNKTLTATLVENSSAVALKELLEQGDITIDMRDYGNMEKVGALGTTIPQNDEYITTEPGDLILYGSAFVIYYDENSYNFTRLGKINDITQAELKELLGSGNVSVTLSLKAVDTPWPEPTVTPTPLPLSDMVVRITSGSRSATFQLYDIEAAAEFYAQLPLTLDTTNFSDAQWMFYPPERLAVKDSESYHDGKRGELSYYEPWGDVFMLYKDFYAGDEMHRLGVCLSGIDEIENMSGSITVEKETAKKITSKYIQLSWNSNKIIVRLNDSKTSESLLNQLPLTLDFSDYAGTEKVAYPPETLDTSDAPSGYDPSVGDLALYAPWGDLAFFYKDFSYASGLVPLGKVEVGEELLTSLSGSVTVEQVTKIKLTFGNDELDAFMYNNPTANAFMDMLPITLPMLDLYSNEMCYRFTDALPYDNAPSKGYEIGDIIYWPPRHSFVIRYAQNGETFEQFIGYIPTGIEALRNIGDIDIQYELAD